MKPLPMLRLFACLLVVTATSGCVSAFTSIQKQEDGSYFLTQTKSGPFFVAGSSWKCVPAGETVMQCHRVAVP